MKKIPLLNLDMCQGEVSNEQIALIQGIIGIKFPKMYLECVKKCDGGCPKEEIFEYFDINHEEILEGCVGGFLCLNVSEYGHVLETYKDPPEFFPKGLIAFAENGGGDYLCFDYRKGKDNPEPPIVFWNHEADIGKDVSFVANSFEEFLGMLKEPEEIEI